jgi:thiamine-monophosphate kinase
MSGQTVREIGEFGLIAALEGALPDAARTGGGVRLSIGDDCALWEPTAGEQVVITTDSLVEEVHFRLDWTGWEDLGHKTLAVNLSDIASMGARAGVAVVTLALRGSERVEDLVAFYRGMGALAVRTGTRIVGGDIVRSPLATAFHVTALGETRGGRALRRDGARVGDVVLVSGTLGASAAGMRLLAEGPESPRRRATTADLLVDAHRRPEPRLALGAALLEGGATAAMDLSDGLLGDLPKILARSGVAAVIDEDAIPVAAAVRALFPDERLALALRGGEDYELLATAPLERVAALKDAARAVGSDLTVVGAIRARRADAPALMLRADGVERPGVAGAFDHFG